MLDYRTLVLHMQQNWFQEVENTDKNALNINASKLHLKDFMFLESRIGSHQLRCVNKAPGCLLTVHVLLHKSGRKWHRSIELVTIRVQG